jgi:hypothetical protein
MLEALVGILVSLLVVAGILVMIGPNLRTLTGRIGSIKRPTKVPSPFQFGSGRESGPSGLNSKTQRVLIGAGRLANWLRANGQDDLARELRGAAAKMAGNEAAGLYALQAVLRKLRSVDDKRAPGHERLQVLANELRVAVQDRFEQLELLPFGRP